MSKKDPRLAIPGFEIYAEMKPILPFWQWFVSILILIVFSSGYWHFSNVASLWSVAIFVIVLMAIVFVMALLFRRRFLTVGLKREGDGLLVAGQTFSESLGTTSRIELRDPLTVYLEKPGSRMQLRRMEIRFSSSTDAKQVVDWLERKPGHSNTPQDTPSAEEVWALVYAGQYIKRSRIQFERNICFVVDPGKNIFAVIPKKLERKDEVTLIANTGFWNLGSVIMKFDSPADANKIEQRLNETKDRQE